jgi:hypothetical protein
VRNRSFAAAFGVLLCAAVGIGSALRARAGDPAPGADADFLRPAPGTFHVRRVAAGGIGELGDLIGWSVDRVEVGVAAKASVRVQLVWDGVPLSKVALVPDPSRSGGVSLVLHDHAIEASPGTPVALDLAVRRQDRAHLLKELLPEDAIAPVTAILDRGAGTGAGDWVSLATRLRAGGAATTLRGIVRPPQSGGAGPDGAGSQLTWRASERLAVAPEGRAFLVAGTEWARPAGGGSPPNSCWAWLISVEPAAGK